MTVVSRLIGQLGRLPPAETHRLIVERGLRVPMLDGVELLADHYTPATSAADRPIVLLRAPYGRGGFAGLLARLFAERGYQTVVQEVRGTGVSGGTFDALRNEREDGLQTLDWLAQQPWFTGAVGMTGLSYLSFAQWAVATDAPAFLKALTIQVSASEFRTSIHRAGTFPIYTTLRWAAGMGTRKQMPHHQLTGWLRDRKRLERAYWALPLRETDAIAAGEHVTFFQDWLTHDQPDDPFWDRTDNSRRMADITADTTLLAGWYDIFLPRQLDDHRALRDAGKSVRLTIGPWHHTEQAAFFAGIRNSLDWFDTRLRGRSPAAGERFAVRIFVMGRNAWRDLPDWPPPFLPTRWHLASDRRLSTDAPAPSTPDRYRYNPANPTPSIGGVFLRGEAGIRDNRKIEARPDVLTYRSNPLDADMEVVGPVNAKIHVRAARPYFDLFVRICDVDLQGRHVNVCDGPVRVSPQTHAPDADGVVRVVVDLWPTAYLFRRGHQVRVHVSSGAFPRISRNLGAGEPLATAATSHTNDIEILHDPDHPSAVILPQPVPRAG